MLFRSKAASHDRPVYTIDYDDARTMLSALADPDVQAGIAGALYRLDNPGLPWEQVREDYFGLAEVYMRRAAAVVEWLRKETNDQGRG